MYNVYKKLEYIKDLSVMRDFISIPSNVYKWWEMTVIAHFQKFCIVLC
jgi:cupin superfamily acireductone dioxygenase involved in methionine salvage